MRAWPAEALEAAAATGDPLGDAGALLGDAGGTLGPPGDAGVHWGHRETERRRQRTTQSGRAPTWCRPGG